MARSARGARREAQITRLRLARAAAWLGAILLAACAKNEDPPGGPPDVAPPHVVRVVPESGAVVPNLKDDAIIHFDEVIDEMPSTLHRQVLLSPVSGAVRVEWHRNNITVKPREGWKRRVYRLQLLPGILDLRRNKLDTGKVVIFSTGPEIGHARIGGIALAWAEQRILVNALIEAVPLPDSVGYLTLADSGGQFNLEGIAPGQYIVYASVDENTDRRRGLREAYDSAVVTVDSSANVALYTFVHDTLGPRLRGAAALDSLTIRIEFTQPLDPTVSLDTSLVHVRELPDSVPVPIAAIRSQRQHDSLTAAAREKADTAARARRDTTAPRDSAAPRQPQQPERKGPPVDTALVRRLLALRPVPLDRMIITVTRGLKPETRYVVQVTGATNLTGQKADGQVSFLTEKPRAPADTTPP